ncbi:MAG: FtsX-like permease family protein, partial [Bacillota bacterium]
IDGTYRPLTISAIVVDPQFSPSMMNPVRAWVADGFFAEHGKQESELDNLIGVRLFDEAQYGRLWQGFEEYLGTPYIGFVFEHEFVKNAYSMVQSIIAMIMLVFSAIIILVSMFVLSFTITNAVMTDYKTIGILKAQGFSARNVQWIYLLQYLLLTVLTAPLGVLASHYALRLILAQMSKSLGIAQLDAPMTVPAILTGSIILLTTLFSSSHASEKAGRIKPAEAIRNAAPVPQLPAKGRLELRTLSVLPPSLILAVKGIFSGRRHSGFLLASAAVLAFVLVFSVNTFHSVKSMDQNYAYWGFDDADVYLSANTNTDVIPREAMLAVLKSDERVQAVLPYQVITNAAIPAQAGQGSKNVIGFM